MLPLTRHGTREMVIGTIVLVAIGWGLSLIWWPLSLIVLPVLIWQFAFFRDPERPISGEPNIMDRRPMRIDGWNHAALRVKLAYEH